jgi:cytoskeletal protein RodZ
MQLEDYTPPSGSPDEKFRRLHDEIGSREQTPCFNEDSGRGDDEIVPEGQDESEGHGRLLHSIWFLLGMAVLGVLLAFTWHKIVPQLWATQPSSATQRTESAEQIQEIDTLKKTISELREAQQQMAATIAFSKAAQHELQLKRAYWYSEPNTLLQPTATAVGPAAHPKQKSTAWSRPEAQGANVARRDQDAPLALAPARP